MVVDEGDAICVMEANSKTFIVFPSHWMTPGCIIIFVCLKLMGDKFPIYIGSCVWLQRNSSTIHFFLPIVDYAWPAPISGLAEVVS